jgi:hypothetical protein
MKSGVYRLSDEHEGKGHHKRSWLLSSSEDDPFNYWSAVKHGTILMFLLWWIPIFGPMIAGYVAGRRAGTPIKGVFAVSIPLAVVFFIATLVTIKVVPTVWFGVDLAPDAIFGALATAIPVFAPFANFTTGYLESFIGTIQGTAGIRLDFFILGIASAYFGGAMAHQSLREMEYLVNHGGGRHAPARNAKSKTKLGFWRSGKGGKDAVESDDEDGPARTSSEHFNDLHETSGSNKAHAHPRSRIMEKADEDDEEPIRKRREKEFERNLNKAQHDAPSKGGHSQHKKLEDIKKSESDDFRFV